MKNVYTEKLVINDTQINFGEVVPINEIMRLFEIAAFNHSDLIGLDHASMIKKSNCFWVVSKIKLQIKGAITSGEKLSVKTWTEAPGLIRFNRNCTIKSQKELKVKGTSEWCCLDYLTHKPRKASSVSYPQLEMCEQAQNKLTFTNLKPQMESKHFVYTKTVRATDIDLNYHTNNLKYNFMALDAFTTNELNSMDIKEYEIYFVNESHEGDKIDIFKQKLGNCYVVEGSTQEKTIFRVVIKFKNKNSSTK